MALIPTCVIAALGVAPLAGAPAPAATPLDAITTIVEAFQRHSIVALEEEHGDARSSAFRLALIRDPRLAAAVNDVVVEFGNAQYQHVIDRFVDGHAVPDDELRRVWQDTTMPYPIWDRPIYEEFFRAVRAINQPLPRDRRLRVLLGDPAFEWSAIRNGEDLQKVRSGRARHPAEVVLREVLSKGRRALVIYGALHLLRQNPQGPNLVERIETEGRTSAFVVVTHPFVSLAVLGVDPSSWPVPSITLTQGSSLAAQVDAVLYLGPKSGRVPSPLSRALCDDLTYRKMRVSRMLIAGEKDVEAQFGAACASAQAKPDFSGTWTPDPMPPPLEWKGNGPPPPPRVIGLTITQSEKELKVDRRLEASGRETAATATYKLDGTPSVNQTGPLQYTTTATWEGSRLVLSSKVSIDEKPLATVQESYSLENGQLIIELTRETPKGPFSGKTIHKKQLP